LNAASQRVGAFPHSNCFVEPASRFGFARELTTAQAKLFRHVLGLRRNL
jgi:hypothetical protein